MRYAYLTFLHDKFSIMKVGEFSRKCGDDFVCYSSEEEGADASRKREVYRNKGLETGKDALAWFEAQLIEQSRRGYSVVIVVERNLGDTSYNLSILPGLFDLIVKLEKARKIRPTMTRIRGPEETQENDFIQGIILDGTGTGTNPAYKLETLLTKYPPEEAKKMREDFEIECKTIGYQPLEFIQYVDSTKPLEREKLLEIKTPGFEESLEKDMLMKIASIRHRALSIKEGSWTNTLQSSFIDMSSFLCIWRTILHNKMDNNEKNNP